jgi:S1-C subfamily serine protease
LAAPAWAAQALDLTGVGDIVEKVHRGVVEVRVIEITSPLAAETSGAGSGFVIDKQGHFLTNFHVAGMSPTLRVTMWDESTYRGHLVAAEPGIDVALCQIDDIPPDKLFPLALGDSDAVEPGETALAMGSPGSQEGMLVEPSDPFKYWTLRQTVTCRVVAGKDTTLEFPLSMWQWARRNLAGQGPVAQYGTNLGYVIKMQTAINQGNSGGPLIDRNCEVIGLNTWGTSISGLRQNSNYAVPINFAKDFAFQILEHGKFERPWLGLDIVMPPNIHELQAYIEFRERFRPKGRIIVYNVRGDSPASAAGFQRRDEILQVDGKTFSTPEDLRSYIMGHTVGDTLSFTISRGGAIIRVQAKLGPKRNQDSEFSA